MMPNEVRSLIYACKQSSKGDGILREGLAVKLIECTEMLLRKQEHLMSQVASCERDLDLHTQKLNDLKEHIIAKVRDA